MKDLDERRKKAFAELSAGFESLSAMAKAFGVSSPAITKWKHNGIPLCRVPFLMLKYPKLEAWKGLPKY